MKDALSFIGAATIVGLCSGVLALAYYAVKDAIHNWRRAYQVKHRFDKPPTAKCYCIDCCFHSNMVETEGSTPSLFSHKLLN